MKTITQIAAELGVSRQAVHKKIKRQPWFNMLSTHISTVDNKRFITNEGVDIIRQAFKGDLSNRQQASSVDDTSTSTGGTTLLDIVKEQQRTIQELTATNRELTAALENATASLKAALPAGATQKQLTDDQDAKDYFIIPEPPPTYIDRLVTAFRLILPYRYKQRKNACK